MKPAARVGATTAKAAPPFAVFERWDYAGIPLKGFFWLLLHQPYQSFLARLKKRKLAPGEAAQAFTEAPRKLLPTHPCGFPDMKFVKHGGLFHGPNGFWVEKCSREIGKYQDGTKRTGNHQLGNCPENLFDLSRRTMRNVDVKDMLSLMSEKPKAVL
jgi:hypothetical protein